MQLGAVLGVSGSVMERPLPAVAGFPAMELSPLLLEQAQAAFEQLSLEQRGAWASAVHRLAGKPSNMLPHHNVLRIETP